MVGKSISLKQTAKLLFVFSFFILFSTEAYSKNKKYNLTKLGVKSGYVKHNAKVMNDILQRLKKESSDKDTITFYLEKGEYHFYESDAPKKEYYISNHDQVVERAVGIDLVDMKNVVFDGNGSELIFHGRMLPITLVNSNNCVLKNFSVDFYHPQIFQIHILSNSPTEGICAKVESNTDYAIDGDGRLKIYGDSWSIKPNTGIAFEGDSKHIVYRTSDLIINTLGTRKEEKELLRFPNWKDDRLKSGVRVAMRSYDRPSPGIFLYLNKNTYLYDVTIHYAEGMGILAQLCENVTLDKTGVSIKMGSERYFTTQADATHFSSCRGKIISSNGLYEAMMDDAINVHGTYLRLKEVLDEKTVIAEYAHEQTYGFEWGFEGDSVQFIRSNTMDYLDDIYRIESITAEDKKRFKIRFKEGLNREINVGERFGLENLSWIPSVVFNGNLVRNNRARGALFSTPQPVIITDNVFDHTSGTAILLCGDCNGWYETGRCRNVIITKNKFINALTNMFQFTNAVISIYPEIPKLNEQRSYFHGGLRKSKESAGGIMIYDNEFHTFDLPLLYAKSVDGLLFRNNKVIRNNDYPAFHWNKSSVLLERVTNASIDY